MPYKQPKIEKVLFSIGEVAQIVGVETSAVRYWGNRFEILQPQKNKKGDRLFTKEDIGLIKLIKYLVRERGLTIKGAKQKLKENREETINNFEIVKLLQAIKQELVEISDKIET